MDPPEDTTTGNDCKDKILGISIIPVTDSFAQGSDRLILTFGAEEAGEHKLDLVEADVAKLLDPNYSSF